MIFWIGVLALEASVLVREIESAPFKEDLTTNNDGVISTIATTTEITYLRYLSWDRQSLAPLVLFGYVCVVLPLCICCSDWCLWKGNLRDILVDRYWNTSSVGTRLQSFVTKVVKYCGMLNQTVGLTSPRLPMFYIMDGSSISTFPEKVFENPSYELWS